MKIVIFLVLLYMSAIFGGDSWLREKKIRRSGKNISRHKRKFPQDYDSFAESDSTPQLNKAMKRF